ncbi:MAG: hypothetical protein Q7U98_12990 [Methylicorpusculum sp.]|uniref:hypothetical protein n=1 Tax=Methylicorpusculum sp. TaxID=2713644 RepID=UPI0027265B68|nr:hypothetical protein [Methylicorpusculum sp.]MDO8940067.1 hypothetical protein [Methylicorpusculum sp.]MDP2201448.1 hypothetical protein [Methylicorpusculum sp.]
MKPTLPVVFAGILSFSLSTQASARLVAAPDLFENGPVALAAIKLESDEITSLMLLESVIDISSSAVLANSCQTLEGIYPIEISADGALNKPETNFGKISSSENTEPLVLNATMEADNSFHGQNINIRQTKNGKLKEILIQEYSSVVTVNRELTLLSIHSNANVSGQNNTLMPHQNLLIKHFYDEQKPDNQNQYILGWGAASLSKTGFPLNLAWLRFKALKASGKLKRVILQEDRLIGNSPCRILIEGVAEIKKDNEKKNQQNIAIKGVMTISRPQSLEDNPVAFEF